MTYCSEKGEHDPGKDWEGYAYGFSLHSIYVTYDDFANDNERKYIEYFLRDAYNYYGYSFHYLSDDKVDEETVLSWMPGFTTMDSYIRDTWRKIYSAGKVLVNGKETGETISNSLTEQMLNNRIENIHRNREFIARTMLAGLHFMNKRKQPLSLIPYLEPDPELLENPIYH